MLIYPGGSQHKIDPGPNNINFIIMRLEEIVTALKACILYDEARIVECHIHALRTWEYREKAKSDPEAPIHMIDVFVKDFTVGPLNEANVLD
jgi:hypothetical protein